MNLCNVKNNICFCGYKNVFCNANVQISDYDYITHLSVQLNDDSYGDLYEFNRLQSMQEAVSSPKNPDVLNVTYLINKMKNESHFVIGYKDMYSGEELLALSERYVPKFLSHEKYLEEEKFHLKAYTFLANLTNRMMRISSATEDIGRINVLQSMHENLSGIFKNPSLALNLVERACYKPLKFQDLAIALNYGISRTMEKFFR